MQIKSGDRPGITIFGEVVLDNNSCSIIRSFFDWVGKNPYLKGVALLPVAIQAIQYWLDKQSDDHNFRFFLYPIALEFVKNDTFKNYNGA